jgi:hypothetical protein
MRVLMAIMHGHDGLGISALLRPGDGLQARSRPRGADAGAEALVRQENETRGYVDMEGHACDDDDDFEQGKDDEEKAEKAK